MNKKVDQQKKARKLRKEKGWSLKEIAEELHVAKSSVSLWVRDIELNKQQTERLNEKRRDSGRAFQGVGSHTYSEKCLEKRKKWQQEGRMIAKKKEFLHSFVTALYWGEGDRNKNVCGMSNTNVHMLKLFIKFLKKYFIIEKKEFLVDIQVYLGNGIKIDDIKNYWIENLKLEESNIRNIKVLNGTRKVSGKKKNIHLYGVCRIRICRTDILQHMFGAMQEYGNFKKDEWL